MSLKCHTIGRGTPFCGPYKIFLEYHLEAWSSEYSFAAINQFKSCSINKECADETVKRYTSKWISDCNQDGKIDCFDYTATHIMGPKMCHQFESHGRVYYTQYLQTQCGYQEDSSMSTGKSTTCLFK